MTLMVLRSVMRCYDDDVGGGGCGICTFVISTAFVSLSEFILLM